MTLMLRLRSRSKSSRRPLTQPKSPRSRSLGTNGSDRQTPFRPQRTMACPEGAKGYKGGAICRGFRGIKARQKRAGEAMRVESVEQFTKLVAEIEASEGYKRPAAYGVGLATLSLADVTEPKVVASASVLDTWYPAPNCDENFGTAAILAKIAGHKHGSRSY